MQRYAHLLFLLIVVYPCSVLASSTLEYEVQGVNSELEQNIRGWLGTEPETVEERANFIASARERAASGLQALGYYQPDIDLILDKNSSPWQLTLIAKRNEPVRITDIDVRFAGAVNEDPVFMQLLDDLPFAQGDIFHHGVYEGFKKKLLALGQQRGYFDAKLVQNQVKVNVEGGTAGIHLQYASGERYRFGDISLDDTVMDMNWVDSVIRFQSGDWFDLALLQQLRAELQQTRFFSSVIVRTLTDQRSNGRVPVSVNVSPASRHTFEFGVGFSTDTQERVSVTWRTPLINRYGHSQETRLEYSPVQPSGRFTYNIPLSHPLNDVLHLSAYLEDREYGDVDSEQKGVRVQREKKIGNWIYSYSARTLDENWLVGSQHRDNSYVLPGATLSHKHRVGSLVDPEAGFHQVYLLEAGAEDVGSDINLLRAYSNFRLILPLGENNRLVSRAELGAVFVSSEDRPDLAPSLSFFTGGSQSIRGFSYQSIGNEVDFPLPDGSSQAYVVGGERLITASVEYQRYFTDTWRGAVFIDGGDAFDEGEFEMHYGGGFGIHYLSPVGAIRLELANDLSEDNPSWRLHVNIGAEF